MINLDPIAEKIRNALTAKYTARERALQLSRDAIRHCANAIRALHRQEFAEAQALLSAARELLAQLGQALAEHPDLRYGGFVHDAQKEYAEGTAVLAIVTGAVLPDPDELQIGYAAYLNGLGEAAGELRRYLLDAIRRGDVSRCEELLAAMDDIYSVLITMDFPDSLTGGLRRTTDMVRGVLERTRGDLTMALRQRDLETKLAAFEGELGSKRQGGRL